MLRHKGLEGVDAVDAEVESLVELIIYGVIDLVDATLVALEVN